MYCSLHAYTYDRPVEFRPRFPGFIVDSYVKIKEGVETVFLNGTFISAAVDHFVKFIKNPSVSVNRLEISLEYFNEYDPFGHDNRKLLEKLEEVLGQSDHQISANCFSLYSNANPNEILNFVRHLKPGTLRELHLSPRYSVSSNAHFDLSPITETPQWKQAIQLRAGSYFSFIPNESTGHFHCVYGDVLKLTLTDAQFHIQVSLCSLFLTSPVYFQSISNASDSRILTCASIDDSVIEYITQFPITQSDKEFEYEIRKQEAITCYVFVRNSSLSESASNRIVTFAGCTQLGRL